jgi:prepilin-type N-terminal cleavage/methylation domain-containing protein
MTRTRRKGGFTLIEVMIIVAVIGVMTALAASVVGRRIGDQRAKAAVRSVANLMQLARSEAIRTGTNHVVYFQLDPADAPLVDNTGAPVAALMTRDADNDGIPDASEYRASMPFDQTNSLSWGSTFAAVGSDVAPNDNPGGTFPATDPNFSCCTFQTPAGNDQRAVLFMPDGVPRAFSTGPFAMGPVGGGGGAVYVTSGTRDYAVVLTPLGSARVHSWNRGADAWTR